jgi:hypothetical protein
MKKLGAILREANEKCRQAGVRLVIAFVPAKFRVYRGLCRFSPDSPCRSWQVDDLPAALGRAVRELSPAIGFVDLTPPFLAAAGQGSLLYLADDIHWSAEGHRLAAEVLADHLAVAPKPESLRVVGSGRDCSADGRSGFPD